MMFARCPACQTVFRLRPEQLSARHGEVRCGHCFNPFNALDHLLTEAGEQLPPPSAEPSAPGGTGPAPHEAATPAQPAADEAAPDANPAAALDFEIPEVWRSPREQLKAGEGQPLPADLRHDAGVVAAPLDTALPPAATPDRPTAFDPRSAYPSSFAASLAEAGAGRSEPTDAPPESDAVAERAHAPAERPAGPDTELPAGWRTPATDEPAAAQLDARYGPPAGGSAGRRWLWSLGVGVMLGALAVQSAYLFRQEITRSLPMLRPLYLAACAQFGCTLPLPRDAERIGIDTSDLQSDPRAPGSYILNATVRNRADYPQDWPHLELTLTDAQDRALVRRVLDPSEWAHAETAKLRAGFPAGREQVLQLRFDAPGVEAVGYRIYLFYP